MDIEKKNEVERPQSISSFKSGGKYEMSIHESPRGKLEMTADEGDKFSDISNLESQPQLKRTLKARHLAVGYISFF